MFKFFERYSQSLAYTVKNLENCDQEPLKFCGAIQDAGYFIACDKKTLKILALSENLAQEIGIEKSQAFFLELNDVIDLDSVEKIDIQNIPLLCKKTHVPVKIRSPKNSKEILQASFKDHPDYWCLDIEKTQKNPAETEYPASEIQNLVNDLNETHLLEEISQKTADHIRVMSGFDRVMIYRFDESWNGEVIAEAKKESLETFLHLHYPASDIPPQARQLYFDTKFRMIVDVQSLPISIYMATGLERKELDLTCSFLRAVSPIHIKYLQNMGVRSSFSLPLKVRGKLWGLVSCHHYTSPMHLQKDLRSACELAAQITSGRISDFLAQRRLKNKSNTLELTQILLKVVSEGNEPAEAFKECEKALLNLTESSGAFIRIAGQQILLGKCPSEELIQKILEKLKEQSSLGVWKSNDLKNDLQLDQCPKDAAGAFAIPFSLGFEDFLIWFRPEEIQEVKWGGQEAALGVNTPKNILEPRSSFTEWVEIVKERSRAWTESDEECAQYLIFNFVQGIFVKAKALSQAYKELENVTRAKDEFVSLISHELRTPLSIILAWIEILKDSDYPNPELKQAIEVIDRNAKIQINLINDLLDISRIVSGKLRIALQPHIALKKLIQEVVESLTPTATTRGITLEMNFSEDFEVSADPDRLRQIFWNIIGNAIKFSPKGEKVKVRARKSRSYYQIEIEDKGIGIDKEHLTTIFDRFTQMGFSHAHKGGLGLGLSIVKALVQLHGGSVEAKSDGLDLGSTFIVSLPVFALQAKKQIPTPVEASEQNKVSNLLDGFNILIAEDQADAAQALVYLLKRNGAECTVSSDGVSALDNLKKQSFDLILSDIGMMHFDGYELIRKWREIEKEKGLKTIPAIALTAYATPKDRTKALEAGFQNHIAKPVDRDELLALIKSLLGKI